MRKLGKISLQNLGQAEMEKRELNALKGGYCICWCNCNMNCGCKYEGGASGPDDSFYGGSSQAVSDYASTLNLISSTVDSTTRTASAK